MSGAGFGFVPTQQGQPGGKTVNPQGRQVLHVRPDAIGIRRRKNAVAGDLLYSHAPHAQGEVYATHPGELLLVEKASISPADGMPLVISSLNGETFRGRSFAGVVDAYDILGIAAGGGSKHNESGTSADYPSLSCMVKVMTSMTNRSGAAWTPGPLMWDFPTPEEAEGMLALGGQIVPILRSYSKYAHAVASTALAAEIRRPSGIRAADTGRAIAGASLRFQSAMAVFSIASLNMWLSAGVVHFDSALFQSGAVAAATRSTAAAHYNGVPVAQREQLLARLAIAMRVTGAGAASDQTDIIVRGPNVRCSDYMRKMLVGSRDVSLIAAEGGTGHAPPGAAGVLMNGYNNMLANMVGSFSEASNSASRRVCAKALAAAPPGMRVPIQFFG